jgi:hypothetical protein
MAPGLATWFSHSSRAASALGQTLARDRRTLKSAWRARRGAPRCPGWSRVVGPRGKTRTRCPADPGAPRRGWLDAGCRTGPITSGVLQQTAGVITDFRAGYAVLGCCDRLAHPTSAELRTAPVRRKSWPAGWRPIYVPTPGHVSPWQCCRHHPQAHCRGPARQGTARPGSNLQFWYGVTR